MLIRILVVVALLLTGQAAPASATPSRSAQEPAAVVTALAAKKPAKPRASINAHYLGLRGGRLQVTVRSNAKKVELTYRTAKKKKRTKVVKLRKSVGTVVLAQGSTTLRAKARATKKLRASVRVTVRKQPLMTVVPIPKPPPASPAPPRLPAPKPTATPSPRPVPTPSARPTDGRPTTGPTDPGRPTSTAPPTPSDSASPGPGSGSPTPTDTASPSETATPAPTESATPTPVPTPVDGPFVSVTAGSAHTCAVDRSGAAWCWGDNARAQLGIGSLVPLLAQRPMQVAGAHVFSSISAGAEHTCAIDTAGAAWCWGDDNFGQLGDGASGLLNRPSPAAVAGGHRFTSISAGQRHTCAIDTAGAAWCWGDNSTGAIGSGNSASKPASTPIAVAGGRTFRQISAGVGTCAVEVNGTGMWCWGDDTGGRLGDFPAEGIRHRPISIGYGVPFTSVSVGANICGLDTDGAAWCWGSNAHGQLGNDDPLRFNWMYPIRVAQGHVFTSISVGQAHVCAVDTERVPWCWGDDSLGQVGDGDASGADRFRPTPVAGGHVTGQVATGDAHSCLIEATGSLWCWGSDLSGQLGDGAVTPLLRRTPGLVTRPTTP